MRSGWVLVALLLAGCVQPDAASPPPSPGPGLLPPALLVDRSPRDTLQLYVHAKQGLVRYTHVNLTLNGTAVASRQATYALEQVLDTPAAEVGVEVVDAGLKYRWQAWLALNLTADPATITVRSLDPPTDALPRDHTAPFEKLLPREQPPREAKP